MLIINSGAYVTPEFQAEFGKIPPCMLPIGNKKLIEHQVQRLKAAFPGRDIFLTLPSTFTPAINEKALLGALGVQCIAVPPNFRLTDSILYALNIRETEDDRVVLLHGDTLIDELPQELDVIGIAETDDDYRWERELMPDNSQMVWCGYFSFSNVRTLIRALTLSEGDFPNAVRQYSEVRDLQRRVVPTWHDLGHVNTYFKSRASITTQRSFNSLDIESGVLTKRGEPSVKIEAEAHWFKNLPIAMRRFTPQLIDSGFGADDKPYYSLEYLPMSPLNELFVHGHNPPFFWGRVLKLIQEYLQESRNSLPADTDIRKISEDAISLYKDKTIARLLAFSEANDFDLKKKLRFDGRALPSTMAIAERCIELATKSACTPAIAHGDLCFSNVLFDSRGGHIKVIDPRGLNQDQELTIVGDQKYDLAKLCHSFIGLYDFIISGRYTLTEDSNGFHLSFDLDDRLKSIQQLFEKTELIPGVTFSDIIPLTVLLFLSMLPLHADHPQRQRALFANALRLYSKYL